MMEHLWTSNDFAIGLSILGKAFLALILAGLIGYEREYRGHPAGMRTHMLLILGVVIMAEAGRHFNAQDPSRIAAQVVTGVGFLGAGTILRVGRDVKGLTTAASLWATAGIGLGVSAGGGLLLVAVLGTGLVLATLTLVAQFERKLDVRFDGMAFNVEFTNRHALKEALKIMSTAEIESIKVSGDAEKPKLYARIKNDDPTYYEKIQELEGVKSAHIERIT